MKDDIANDLEKSLKVVSGTINGFTVCISKIQHTMYKVNYNGLTSCVNNYFYNIELEGLM